MKPACINCFYYCQDVFRITGKDYDYRHSFCGLHGGAEITNPYEVQTVDFLNGRRNEQYPECRCSFLPKRDNKPIQLALQFI